MNIGLDIDGVLYPWHYSIYRYFIENKGYEGDIGKFWLEDRHIVTDYHVGLPTLYLDTSPTEDVLTYVPKLAELGNLFYITSRSLELESVTRKFLDKYKFPFKENLIFAENKATPVRLYAIDYFLDDMPKHVDSLQNITNVYLFKCIHNRLERENYKVINSIKEFYNLLVEEKNAKQVD